MSRKNTSSDAMNLFQGEERRNLFELISLVTSIFLGVGIIVYVFVINPQADEYEPSHSFGESSYIVKTGSSRHHAQTSSKRQDWVSYSGELETFRDITFSLKGYDSDAEYEILFGDGKHQICDASSIQHYYKRPGRYTVTVKMKYENKKTKIWRKIIKINRGTEIDSSAY